MPPLINLAGRTFGSWSVVSRGENNGTITRWVCRCDCGTESLVQAEHLRESNSTNCGCQRVGPIKHGAAVGGSIKFSLAYRSWRAMRARILNPRDKAFPHYGGRGITICDRWSDFANFLADMGERPSVRHSIDRRESNGNYEPGNCRWATQAEQVENLPQNQKGYRHKRGTHQHNGAR
jgi:hypothetical protein